MLLRTLNKIISDSAEGIVVTPYWPSQVAFPILQKLAKSDMLVLEDKDFITPSNFSYNKQGYQKLSLVAAILSARP